MGDMDLDLEAIQKVVDLGPYKLCRCRACRGVNLQHATRHCGWCGADLATGVVTSKRPASAPQYKRSSSRQRRTRAPRTAG
ncbi:MAG: hypothetical protein ACYTFT_09675 [Planctomycetota bacterium]|jgi:hypothetical protein